MDAILQGLSGIFEVVLMAGLGFFLAKKGWFWEGAAKDLTKLTMTFSDKNAYWVCNMTSNMVYPRYSQLFPSLKEVRDSLDNSYFAAQKEVEAKAQELYAQNPQQAVKYLNDYGIEKAQQMLTRWKQLFQFMVVKYNDMIIKPTDKDGNFVRTKEGLGARPVRPGYPEKYAKELIKQTGDKFVER